MTDEDDNPFLSSASNNEPSSSSSSSSTSAAGPQISDLAQFNDIFTGCLIYIHKSTPASSPSSSSASTQISATDERLLSRFIAAYDGETTSTPSPRVTHILTTEPYLT